MRQFFKNRSLLHKISLVIGGSILVVEILLMIPSVFFRRAQLFEEFHGRHYEIFHTMEQPLISRLVSHRLNEAKDLLDILKKHPGFRKYWLADSEGKIVLFSDSKDLQKSDDVHRKILRHKNFSYASAPNGQTFYNYRMGSPTGAESFTLSAVFSHAVLDGEVYAYALRIFLLTLIIIALTSFVVIFGVNSIIINPIKRIVRANKTMNFIDVNSFPGDEIGQLMESRHQMLRKLRDYQNHLEEMVAKRTEELRHAYKKLKMLDKVKDDFLTLISHEIRTPLAVIQNCFHLFHEKILKRQEIQSHILDVGMRNTERLARLADLSLDISVLNARKLLFQKEPFELKNVVLEVVEKMRPQAQKKGVTLSFSNSFSGEDSVAGNRERFLKIINSVLENALQASADGSEILVQVTSEKEKILIQIRDFGAGISLEKQKHIFKPFQISDDILSHSQGLGLSLFWAKRVLKFMGGRIYFLSQPGRGTTFFIEMPRWHVGENAVQSKAA